MTRYVDNEADVNDAPSHYNANNVHADGFVDEDNAYQYKQEVTDVLVNSIQEYLSFSSPSDLIRLVASQL